MRRCYEIFEKSYIKGLDVNPNVIARDVLLYIIPHKFWDLERFIWIHKIVLD